MRALRPQTSFATWSKCFNIDPRGSSVMEFPKISPNMFSDMIEQPELTRVKSMPMERARSGKVSLRF